MSLSDPIGDMIARVKNAQARNHKKVELPSSNFKTKIADILKNEGFIKNFKIIDDSKKPILSLELKYLTNNLSTNFLFSCIHICHYSFWCRYDCYTQSIINLR